MPKKALARNVTDGAYTTKVYVHTVYIAGCRQRANNGKPNITVNGQKRPHNFLDFSLFRGRDRVCTNDPLTLGSHCEHKELSLAFPGKAKNLN